MPLSIVEARLGAGRNVDAAPRSGRVSSVLPTRRINSRAVRPENHQIACDDMEVEGGPWEARWHFQRETRRLRWPIASAIPQEDHPAFPKPEASLAHESPEGVRPLDCNRFSLFASTLVNSRRSDRPTGKSTRNGAVPHGLDSRDHGMTVPTLAASECSGLGRLAGLGLSRVRLEGKSRLCYDTGLSGFAANPGQVPVRGGGAWDARSASWRRTANAARPLQREPARHSPGFCTNPRPPVRQGGPLA